MPAITAAGLWIGGGLSTIFHRRAKHFVRADPRQFGREAASAGGSPESWANLKVAIQRHKFNDRDACGDAVHLTTSAKIQLVRPCRLSVYALDEC
jgi:hypothetical protein